MKFFAFLMIGTFVGHASASRGEHHAYDAPGFPGEWTMGERADSSASITLYFFMKNQNVDTLEDIFLAVSDPTNARYGQHLSLDEVNALVAPAPEALAALQEHVGSSLPLRASTPNSDMVEIDVSIALAERILACEYYEYTHATTGETAFRTPAYSLPRSVAAHVAAVAPTVLLHSYEGGPRPRASRRVAAPDALINVPSTLRTLYGVNKPVEIPQNTFSDRTRCIAQLHVRPPDPHSC